MSEAVFVQGLTKAYNGRMIVDYLNLSVKSGTVFGLLGGILISGESHSMREYIGAGVILLSVIVSGLGGVSRGDVKEAAGAAPEGDDTNRQDDKNCT